MITDEKRPPMWVHALWLSSIGGMAAILPAVLATKVAMDAIDRVRAR